ncbi:MULTISPECIES: response regulator transcription factor [Nostoc]|uniref:Response regulator transcription factor n=1 Tax=Nostoc paludosum FACHB-159 TaxID=2692908 RepID=A0ABR8K5U3_9NOSO|nr:MULTISPECIES: response regulator transcription factor [Nostoc]MBD2678165.1 response regulator transcription factor [Nostoc sp. FACHB-857]MBD2734425.1 response regulator transcription factor [Nostoc paludosum FACHB-159]
MIRLLLVDDQNLFRQGLATMLSVEADLEIVGQASNGQQAIHAAKMLQPQVILMDVRMPVCDGVQATREIHQYYPWIRILVLTTFDDDEYILQSLQAGALGYLLKRTPAPEIASAIRSVAQGYSQLGPTIAPKAFSQLKSLSDDRVLHSLSKREVEVLKLVGEGKNNQEIALELYLSEGTVKNHVSQILSKLEMRDRVAAALWAQRNLL